MKHEHVETDEQIATRVRGDAAKQAFLRLIGAELTAVHPGYAEFSLPFREELGQQHGFLHAGVVTTIADVAAGYAAYTLMPPASEVLSVEFKVNLLRPGVGERFVARGKVLKPGRTLMAVQADVFAIAHGGEKLIASLQGTMICRRHHATGGAETSE
ncbi:MAG TPA: PaaI family thioesterase [Steroidobacteraceae bacterium]|jgi:uncharacterized protein (TIGR00369 family)|nr:PaaI family thioesterase [Steroidobacteraceae bacterium]